MGIAIRRDACGGDVKSLVERYEKQVRPSLTVCCPQSNCGQQYVVYFDQSVTEAEVREGFLRYLRRDHPDHPPLYEIDESIPNPTGE